MTRTTDLNRVPRHKLLPRLAWFGLKDDVGRALARLRARGPERLTMAALGLPDSRAVREATEMVRQVSPGFVFGHAMRSYLFGKAIGRHMRMSWDDEVFCLSALMHDLGLTETHDGPGSFELNGARAATDWMAETQGITDERADRVHEAIALHAAIGIADKGSPELRLVHYGAGLDVVGLKRYAVHPGTLADVLAAAPRDGFAPAFAALLDDQARRKPDSHIAGLVGCGFGAKMLANPIDRAG